MISSSGMAVKTYCNNALKAVLWRIHFSKISLREHPSFLYCWDRTYLHLCARLWQRLYENHRFGLCFHFRWCRSVWYASNHSLISAGMIVPKSLHDDTFGESQKCFYRTYVWSFFLFIAWRKQTKYIKPFVQIEKNLCWLKKSKDDKCFKNWCDAYNSLWEKKLYECESGANLQIILTSPRRSVSCCQSALADSSASIPVSDCEILC